jgi:hypothetical protein
MCLPLPQRYHRNYVEKGNLDQERNYTQIDFAIQQGRLRRHLKKVQDLIKEN